MRNPRQSAYRAIALTDLDGTLLDSQHRLSPRNRSALQTLGRMGVLRVVATGRSPYSAYKVIDADFPIDYLACSSGAAVIRWPDAELVHSVDLPGARALQVAEHLVSLSLDFMLHRAVPDNHRFWFHRAGPHNPDFEARLARYSAHAECWSEGARATHRFSQLLAVEPASRPSRLRHLREHLEDLHVILATSPLDGESRWLEVFPGEVSKAAAGCWLQGQHDIDLRHCMVIGNDYNDEAMLEWGVSPYVVANAPPALTARYPVVASNDDGGFADAVFDWLRREGLD